VASGLGGLGLEGIVGSEEYDGEWETPPATGVGKSGSVSGDWVGETTGSLSGAAAEMVETCILCWELEEEAKANEQLHANMAIISIAQIDQKGVISDGGKLYITLWWTSINISWWERENCSRRSYESAWLMLRTA